MSLIEELRLEHETIERVLGSFRRYVEARLEGSADAADAARFVAFFRTWAGGYHHAREEGVLFPALVREVGLPDDRGPLFALRNDHRRMAVALDEIAALLASDLSGEGVRARLSACSIAHARALWSHVDAENSVLFPESEARLARAFAGELGSRPPTEAEERARDEGAALVAKYPPLTDTELVRGEGCAICPAFGVQCEGVEREWWSEHEWDEFADHLG